MLKDILEEKKLSIYSLAEKAEVPYSTLSDLVSGKTSMEKVSASVLFRLSGALEMSMEQLYRTGMGMDEQSERTLWLYNEASIVYVVLDHIRLQYQGPKNLVGFHRVNRYSDYCISVDTWFEEEDGTIINEEDYVDLGDLFEEFHYDLQLLDRIQIRIGRPGESQQDALIRGALLVSDYMAVSLNPNSTDQVELEVVNIARTNARMIMRLQDYSVLSTNMKPAMQKRAISAVSRNRKLIELEIHGTEDSLKAESRKAKSREAESRGAESRGTEEVRAHA